MSPPHYLVNPKVILSYWDFAAATGQVVREWNCVCFHFTSLVTCRMMGWLSQAFNAHIFAITCPICSWTNRRETGHRVNLQIYRTCGADNQGAWQKALAILLYARSISSHFQQINNSWWIMRLIGSKNNVKQIQTQRMDTFNLSYDVACLTKISCHVTKKQLAIQELLCFGGKQGNINHAWVLLSQGTAATFFMYGEKVRNHLA